jgi:hypothetical protein
MSATSNTQASYGGFVVVVFGEATIPSLPLRAPDEVKSSSWV